jgi:POT family proton-dependent oligopeptide transporter
VQVGMLELSDNGTGMASAALAKAQGLGFETMPGDGFALRHAGIDAVLGNDDDIQMGFEPDGTMAGFVNQEADAINKAIDRIGGFWEDQKKLPSTAEGTKILAGITDPWGQQIRYQIKTGISFFVTSDGPDKVWQSEYDIRAEVTVSSQTPSQQRESIANAGSGDLLGFARPETTWLERRKREIAAEGGTDIQPSSSGDGSDSGPAIDEAPDFGRSIRWDIGGANQLSGASYFWFFTYVMLGTAVLFVPVGWLYRPKTYLQEEDGDGASTEKSAA